MVSFDLFGTLAEFLILLHKPDFLQHQERINEIIHSLYAEFNSRKLDIHPYYSIKGPTKDGSFPGPTPWIDEVTRYRECQIRFKERNAAYNRNLSPKVKKINISSKSATPSILSNEAKSTQWKAKLEESKLSRFRQQNTVLNEQKPKGSRIISRRGIYKKGNHRQN